MASKSKKWRDVGKGRRVAVEASLPGVWRTEDGAWWVRGRVKDPRTGLMREVSRFVEAASARAAFNWLQEQLDAIRLGLDTAEQARSNRIRFSEFAASLFERKVETGEIRSAAGRVKWAGILEHHLIPAFGNVYCDAMTHRDLAAWRRECARRVQEGELAPTTVNGWISVLKVITKALAIDLELDRDTGALLQPLSTIGHRTYTPEEPNALRPQDVPAFVVAMARLHPAHHAMTVLGFVTGLRPSSLRPLRRSGPHADVLWDEGYLLVRRSQTYGDEVMESTKTGRDQRIALPGQIVAVLRAHCEELPAGPQRESALLFPSRTGGYRSRSCLDKPFRDVAKEIGLPYKVTPRGMRRTFQDIARAAALPDLVTRSISGHATESMQHHYSTVGDEEQRAGLGRVADLIAGWPSK